MKSHVKTPGNKGVKELGELYNYFDYAHFGAFLQHKLV